jgi:hypothetical protein
MDTAAGAGQTARAIMTQGARPIVALAMFQQDWLDVRVAGQQRN